MTEKFAVPTWWGINLLPTMEDDLPLVLQIKLIEPQRPGVPCSKWQVQWLDDDMLVLEVQSVFEDEDSPEAVIERILSDAVIELCSGKEGRPADVPEGVTYLRECMANHVERLKMTDCFGVADCPGALRTWDE